MWTNKEIKLLDSLYGDLPENTLLERLYKLRMLEGLSILGFAKKANLHDTTVQRWEEGRKIPKEASIKKVCAAFGVDLGDILKNES